MDPLAPFRMEVKEVEIALNNEKWKKRESLESARGFLLCFFYFQDLLSSVFFRKFARKKYKYNKEVKMEVKVEVKMEVKVEVKR